MALCDVIKKAMGDMGVNAFAKKAGIDAGNLSRILKGQPASAKVLKKIADASDFAGMQEIFESAGYGIDENSGIPIYGTVSGGLPINAYEEILGEIAFDKSLPGKKEDYFALKVSGNSMDMAHIPDKSVIIVKKQNTVCNGETGVFLIGEDATVKIFKKEADKIYLIPKSSEDFHKVQVYDRNDDVRVLGVVKKAVIDF